MANDEVQPLLNPADQQRARKFLMDEVTGRLVFAPEQFGADAKQVACVFAIDTGAGVGSFSQ